jgi:hypothetical protein
MCRSSVRCPSDLPGVNAATNDRVILYYGLMTKADRSYAIVRYFPRRVVTQASVHLVHCAAGTMKMTPSDDPAIQFLDALDELRRRSCEDSSTG